MKRNDLLILIWGGSQKSTRDFVAAKTKASETIVMSRTLTYCFSFYKFIVFCFNQGLIKIHLFLISSFFFLSCVFEDFLRSLFPTSSLISWVIFL